MEITPGGRSKFALLDLPWAFVRFVGRLVRRCLVAVGVLVVLAAVAYVELEAIVEFVDSRYAREIDNYLGIDARTIERLEGPDLFRAAVRARQRRPANCRLHLLTRTPDSGRGTPLKSPPLFVSAILASEDKNFFSHEGVDKGAIVRALIKRSLRREPLRGFDLDDADRQAPSRRDGRASTEIEKIGDVVMALRSSASFRAGSCC